MCKRKLSDEKIKILAIEYATSKDSITIEHFSVLYKVSISTIANALHYAISHGIVDEKTSLLISEKAIRNKKNATGRIGYKSNNQSIISYDSSLTNQKNKPIFNKQFSSSSITKEIVALKHLLNTYHDTFSEGDDPPYTIEELERRIFRLEFENSCTLAL